MQGFDWNDLKYALALHRTGTLSAAGRELGASETTVGRRVKALQNRLHARLFERTKAGRYQATELGLAVLDRAERIETESADLAEMVGAIKGRLFGTVRLTSVPAIVNRVLVPRLRAFRMVQPDIALELVPEAANLSLSRREADLAVRFARPETGGLKVKARKIGELAFAVYQPADAGGASHTELDWIGYAEARSWLAQAHWIEAACRRSGGRLSHLRVFDAETALEAVASGAGQTLLPRIIADGDPRLKRADTSGQAPLPSRDIWLLFHAGDEQRRSVGAVKDWLIAMDWAV